MRRPTTRGFLGTVAATIAITVAFTGAVAVAHAPSGAARHVERYQPAVAKRASSAAVQRPHAALPTSADTWQIFLDGSYVGNAKGVAGCTSYADVITTDGESTLGDLVTDPCVIRHGQMDAAFETWLNDQINGSGDEHEIGVIALNRAGAVVAASIVREPRLLTFTIPAADAGSSALASFTSKIGGSTIRPVSLETFSPGGGVITGGPMRISNFKVDVNEVLQPGVSNVDAITLSRHMVGERPGPWTVSDFSVTTGYSKTGIFSKWYAGSVLRGPTTSERRLTLSFLTPNFANTLFTVSIPNAGLYRGDGGFGTTREWQLYAEAATIRFP